MRTDAVMCIHAHALVAFQQRDRGEEEGGKENLGGSQALGGAEKSFMERVKECACACVRAYFHVCARETELD